MKLVKKLLLGLFTLLLFPIFVDAASGTVKVSGSTTAVVGNQVKVTVTLASGTPIGSWKLNLNYDKAYLSLVASSAEAGGTIMANSSSGVKSKSYTFTFKALKSGTTKVAVSSYEAYAYTDMSEMSLSPSSLSVKLMTQSELEATYSKDNNLKSLSVEGYELTPAFNKDTLEYNLSIPSTVTKVNIAAVRNDSTASVVGDGEKEVVEGNNKFEIVVTAQNGGTKKYILNIEVEDLNPIDVKIDNENYTIIKRADVLTKPTTFEETKVKINDIEIPGFKNDETGFVLVGLKDKEGKVLLAIYDEDANEFKLYNEIVSNSLSLYITSFKEELKKYKKTTVTIKDVEFEGYKYKDNSRFVIVYAMNVGTGKYDYYSYDTREETFQIWNQEEISSLREDAKIFMYISVAFGVGLIFLFLLIVCLLSKKGKKGKNKKVVSESANKGRNGTEEMFDLLGDSKRKDKK